jgi:hypothetical protein
MIMTDDQANSRPYFFPIRKHATVHLSFLSVLLLLAHPTTTSTTSSASSFESSNYSYYLFDRAICTGLGDRVGTLLTLAALARIHDSKVVFPWCVDASEIYSRVHPHIPRWYGYNYNLSEFKKRFTLSLDPHIFFVERITAEQRKTLPRVQWEGIGLPAEHGSDSVYTIAWKTTRLGNHHKEISAGIFKDAYQAVARPLTKKHHRAYIALHLRGPDDNTYCPPSNDGDDMDLYCTGKVLRRLLALNTTIIAISNNQDWANELLGGRLKVREFVTAYDDFELLLGASAIVQHAWGGWSSFSSVPAFASGAPLINTFRGLPHRYRLFQEQGGLPSNMYDCKQQSEFVKEALKL